jgi:D-alanyl-D-alanine endopeptidase (penicillin-binding protein 7)
MAYGLHDTEDPLDLKSSVALVIDQDTNEVLFSKNSQAVLPVASITKLMTALVVIESGSSLEAPLTVSQDDVDTEKGSGSRLRVGTELSRGEMLHLALMSSENRAAHALGRHHPGGLPAFIDAMNRKARELGMFDTRYVEPTGLSSANQSSAHDLTLLVKAASRHAIIRELSTSLETQVAVGKRQLQFRNTNGLVRNPDWDIGLQKTGYISEAGRCVVMQAQLAGRTLIMVLLDSAGKYSRIGDAERLRKWLADSQVADSLAPLPTFK